MRQEDMIIYFIHSNDERYQRYPAVEIFKPIRRGKIMPVRCLNLNNSMLEAQNWSMLEEADLSQLCDLNLSNHPLREKDIEQLQNFKMQSLQYFQANHCNLTNIHLKIMIQTDWENLKTVSLAENRIKNGGVAHLVACRWKKLRELNLQSNYITNDGLRVLTRANWNRLELLELYGNYISDEGMFNLNSANFRLLSEVKLGGKLKKNPQALISPVGCKALVKFDTKKIKLILQLKSSNLFKHPFSYFIKDQIRRILEDQANRLIYKVKLQVETVAQWLD